MTKPKYRSRYRDHARVGVYGQLFDDRERVDGLCGQRAAELSTQLLDGSRRPHGPLVQGVEKVGCDLRGAS